jgi:hypothetical protein
MCFLENKLRSWVPDLDAPRAFGVFPYEITLAYAIFMGQLTKSMLLGRGTGSQIALQSLLCTAVPVAFFYKIRTLWQA